MSQPIPRYSIDRNSRYGFVDNTEGKFCEYRDYAALAAENEQLNYKLGRLLMAEKEWELVEPGEYARMKTEVERLRKAGDAMYAAAVQDSTGLWLTKPFEDWAKAKEGR